MCVSGCLSTAASALPHITAPHITELIERLKRTVEASVDEGVREAGPHGGHALVLHLRRRAHRPAVSRRESRGRVRVARSDASDPLTYRAVRRPRRARAGGGILVAAPEPTPGVRVAVAHGVGHGGQEREEEELEHLEGDGRSEGWKSVGQGIGRRR